MSDDPQLKWVDGKYLPLSDAELAQRAIDAAAQAAPPPTVTGNQWAFALRDLSLAEAWEGALIKSKASDRNRERRIARDTPLSATDPLLARIAGNAGVDEAGRPRIDPAAVFARALTEPL